MARSIDIRSDLAAPMPAAATVRQHILDEAAHLFLTSGYAETTLRQIAASVGMKAGSIYHHFASKDEILETILVSGIDVMVQSFHQAREDTGSADAHTRLAAHIRAHLGSLFEHGPYTATHVTTFPYAPAAVRERIVPIRDGYEALWTDMLRAMAAVRAIDIGASVAMTRLILFGAMNSSIEWFDPNGDRSIDWLSEAITHQFWSGVSGSGRS
jgi:TetR/AcrR family transcriptional regulator, cholesterol catabolism regulator